MMDSYAAQLTQPVRDLAWRRGYIVLYHNWGTTALAQVNDTHLHAPFSKIYQDLETECFLRRQEVNGSKDIGRTNQGHPNFPRDQLLGYLQLLQPVC